VRKAVQKTTLTSKVGILTHRDHIKGNTGRRTTNEVRTGAFTFVEVMVALVIVSISLLALLRLHVMSVNMMDKAQVTSRAVFLANAKIADALAVGFPEEGTRSGAVTEDGLVLNWTTRVENAQPSQPEDENVRGLHKVLVNVNWKRGTRPEHLELLTYVADRKRP
jgi:type II secretion system protein I